MESTGASEGKQAVGTLLRDWRQRRRLSQLDLAADAEISTRHLSFVETGRSTPSRSILLRLADRLDVPLRERNVLLTAAGYAAVYPSKPIDDPALRAARSAIDQILQAHEPFPALAVDRHWRMVAFNRAVPPLLAGVEPALLDGDVNVLRLSLHPGGLAPRIANYPEWRAHLLARLMRQVELTADVRLSALLDEISGFPAPPGAGRQPARSGAAISLFVPLQLVTGAGVLSFLSTTTMFGTPVEVTLSELAIESFFPADEETAAVLRGAAQAFGGPAVF